MPLLRIHVGTSGYNYPEWKGTFYRDRRDQRDVLPGAGPEDAHRLGELLGALPPEFRAAFEFRHASWFDDETCALLRGRNAALCLADTDAGATPAVATADWGYVRLRAAAYSDADLARWLATIRQVGAGWREAFVFFKHEDAGAGPALARRLLALRERAPEAV